MIDRVLRERIMQYHPGSSLEQENIITESLQHFVLCYQVFCTAKVCWYS